ncbi:uncharacterized protein LOC134267838 [Saccostrea cucullata]|uniref:uncharacterized protein LOC134267838 n=1 Tax=Saccostrea cuccullata TaxID=36930 RepID=UPI002ED11035
MCRYSTAMVRLTLTLIYSLLISLEVTKALILPAYNLRSASNHKVMALSGATDGKAVLVSQEQPLSLNVCIRKQSMVRLDDVRFSNYNYSTFFNVTFNSGEWMGTFYVRPGMDWNRFKNTGIFPHRYTLEPGWHVIKIYVMDYFGYTEGIAVDTLQFSVDDPWMDNDILSCKTICTEKNRFPVRSPSSSENALPSGIEQRSFSTKCAEVDNIDIPLYNAHVDSFTITASLPQYKSFSNRREENTTNCPHLSPELWRFDNFNVSSSSAEIINNKGARMSFYSTSSNEVYIIVRFFLEGQKKGSVDAKIGSLLTLHLKTLTAPTMIKLRYKEKWGNLSLPITHNFTHQNLQFTWTIPDFTWTEDSLNYIILTAESENLALLVNHLRLEKRAFKPEKHVTIYKSDDVHIVAVYVEMWWLAPDRMTVYLTNGQTYEDVAYLQIYRPIPWNNGYSQVLVLYQDGNARFIPVTPEGLDWIPFGTSVILGQTYSDSIRPYTSIKQLNIDPERWTMRIFFKDGGSMLMKINSTYSETQAHVSEVFFTRDRYTLPFATVRSMYVSEGNTDVDSVKVDDKETYHIMDQWGYVQGRSFAFYRSCISRHLTLSPDIQIDVFKTKIS